MIATILAYVFVPHYPSPARSVHVYSNHNSDGTHHHAAEQPMNVDWGTMLGVTLCVILIVACVIAYDIRRTPG